MDRATELQAALASYKTADLPAKQKIWEGELKLLDLRALPANIAAILLTEPKNRTVTQTKQLSDYHGRTDKHLAELTKAVADHQKKAPKLSVAQTLSLGTPRTTHVLLRGDFLRPGAVVETRHCRPPAPPPGSTSPSGSWLRPIPSQAA